MFFLSAEEAVKSSYEECMWNLFSFTSESIPTIELVQSWQTTEMEA